MHKGFGLRTIAATGVAQPLVGTTLTAASLPNSNAVQSLPVADSSIFDQGQWAVIDVLGSGPEERVMVLSIPDATHIVVQGRNQGAGTEFPHVINSIVRPARLISTLSVQAKDGNTAALWLGASPAVTTAGVAAIFKLVQVAGGTQPNDFFDAFMSGAGANPSDLAEFWIVGTLNDQYIVAISAL